MVDRIRTRTHTERDLDVVADIVEGRSEPIDYTRRDLLLRQYRLEFMPGTSGHQAADKIISAMAIYIDSADYTSNHQYRSTCPEEIRGTRRGKLWEINRAGGPLPGDDRLRRILGRPPGRLPKHRHRSQLR